VKPWDSYEYLKEEYVIKQRSTSALAKEHGVFPNTIRRALKRYGFELRDKSKAQKLNIERNGAPMEGKVRTTEERLAISYGLQRFWDGLGPEQTAELKERLSETGRSKWENMDEKARNDAIGRMHTASRYKAGEGSKNENLVAELLKEAGYAVHQRTNEYTPNRQFEIDMALPVQQIAIEWDGATHFDPIYGRENLARVMRKDRKKDKILIASGWTVLRCRDRSTTSSMAFCRRAVNAIIEVINQKLAGKVRKNTPIIIEAK
jgi:very-short-patch-repair endonuclease